jgi:hypothetical protein
VYMDMKRRMRGKAECIWIGKEGCEGRQSVYGYEKKDAREGGVYMNMKRRM